jgi:transposase
VSENLVKQGGPPLHRRPSRRSLFDPYAAYVLSRWQEGVHDGQQLFEEIQAQGFKGTARLVRRFLQTLREKRRPLTDLAPPDPSERFSARKAVWLFIREQTALPTEEQEDLTFIRQASPTAEMAYGLVQDFLTMMRKRQGERLDAWIEAVQESAICELRSFVSGLLKDKDAVVAGLTLPYSNGPVEAQVQVRETWSSARCLAERNFLCYDNACCMLPNLYTIPSPGSFPLFCWGFVFFSRLTSRQRKRMLITPSFCHS